MSGERYHRLAVRHWHDARLRRLDAEHRVVRFYAGFGPQANSCGCYRFSLAVAVEDLGGTPEAFEERLETVVEVFGWEWDPVARVIWITDWFDLNPPANPNVVASWVKLLKNVPDCDVKNHAIASINNRLKELPASFREPFKELSKSFPSGNGLGKTRTENRTETNQVTGNRDQVTGNQEAGFGVDGKLLDLARAAVRVTTNEPLAHTREELRKLDRDCRYTEQQMSEALELVMSEARAIA